MLPRWLGRLARCGWTSRRGDADPLFVVGHRGRHDIAVDEHWSDVLEEDMEADYYRKFKIELKGGFYEYVKLQRLRGEIAWL
jgi:hypothetical protein